MAKFGLKQFVSPKTFCTHYLGESLDCMLAVELRYSLKEISVCWCPETNGQVIPIKYSTCVDYHPTCDVG